MLKLKKIYLFYSDFSEEYSMEIEIGNEKRKVSFKMDDAQTRKAITPLLDALCEACAVEAGELKRQAMAAINGDETAE